MTFSRSTFIDYTSLDEPVKVNTASSTSIFSIREGLVALKISVKGKIRDVVLTDVLYVLHVTRSLISVSQLEDRRIVTRTLVRLERGILIKLDKKVIAIVDQVRKSYILTSFTSKGDIQETALATVSADDSEV